VREQVSRSESVLDSLEADLQAIDVELLALAQDHNKYQKLEQICASLEELDELGAGHLFWDEVSSEHKATHLDHARSQIGKYHEAIVEVENRRDALVEDIEQRNVELDCLHYDLQDIVEQKEDNRYEWLLEREDGEEPKQHIQIMPWARGCEEDRRFRRSLASSLAACLAIALMISTIAIPIRDRAEELELPERVARLVRQERQLPPPPPPAPEPEIAEDQPSEPDPELVEELPPEPLPVSADEPQVAQEPDTREQVKSKGILAFSNSFASRAQLRPTAQLGSDASVNDAGAEMTGRPERMMVTTTAPGSSGGINLADYSRDFGGNGGDGIAGVQLSRVASSIGGGDGPDRPLASGAAAGRTDEEIQIVFDRYKAALYRLYNRELRNDPTLRGQLVLKLTIEPDGTVSLCELHSASMDAPTLADQVVTRVRSFDFGAKEDIVAVTIIYPIDFLPAG
jgi:outer membrane biosynthesis protein TonB